MRKEPLWAALIALVPLATLSYAASQRKHEAFDRLAVVQRFVDSVYPGLKHVHGLLLSRSLEFHLSPPNGLTGEYIDIVPCRPGSGVPGDGELPSPSLPHCTGLFLPGFSEFLTMGVGYSDKFPIREFQARGSFVDGKSQPTKEEIVSHPEWTRREWTDAVLRANPRFSPDQKEDFVRSIPLQAIAEFTGCQLDTATASFWVDRLEVNPDPVRVEIQWHINGKKKNSGRPQNACQATFEPFEGKLLSVEAQ